LNDPFAPLQIPVVVGPLTIPDKEIAALFLQTFKFSPAFTVGALVKFITTVSFTWLQFPLFEEFKIKLTEPAAISEAFGV